MMADRQFSIEWVGTPNYRQGRSGRKPITIVDHITAGRYPGCLSWMQNPAAQASAHYLITKAGQIFQLVKDVDTAWHAGAVNKPNWPLYDGTNPNRYTIGIEHEGMPGDALTEEQYQATLWLHRQLIESWGILVDQDHIIGHYRIDSVDRPNCPGPGFPWDRLFSDLEGRNQPMPEDWKLKVLEDAKSAGLITSVDHDPDRTLGELPLWFLLALMTNFLKAVKGG